MRPKNQCGVGALESTRTISVNYCFGGGFTVVATPNPAKANLYVSITDEDASLKKQSSQRHVRFDLYDVYTRETIKQWQLPNGQRTFTLSLAGVPKGLYILTITKGGYQQNRQIIVE